MKASVLFQQYAWLVETIRRERRVSLAELDRRWRQTSFAEGRPLSRTTFNRHRNAIEEIYGIVIACDADNRYYILDHMGLHHDSVQQWMMDTLAVNNIVGEARGLHDRILLESIPTEGERLRQVVESMRRATMIDIRYLRYGRTEESHWRIGPCCIKLFRRRWYLPGLAEAEPSPRYIVFSLDRITSLAPADEPFHLPTDFDAERFFAESFGVMADDRLEARRIVLRAFGNERFAMRDLPLHPSQTMLDDAADHTDFAIRLRPTSDFIAHILSRGRWVKVLEPEDIAQQVRQMHQEAAEA